MTIHIVIWRWMISTTATYLMQQKIRGHLVDSWSRLRRQPPYEDDLNIEVNLKNEDDLKMKSTQK